MFNSKLKIKGYSLEEAIHEGVFGNIPELTIDDWSYLEYLLNKEREENKKLDYDKGYQDGNDQAWNMIFGDEED